MSVVEPNFATFRAFGATQTSAFSQPDAIAPSTTFANENAMIEIHDDCPSFVRRRYEATGIRSVRFQFLETPITETMNPRYENIAVMSRSEDYMSYGGTDNRRIPLNLIFVASTDQYDNGCADLALRQVAWLRTLTLPSYDDTNNGLVYPPALCRLILGKFIAARGVVTAFEIQHEAPWVGNNLAFEYPMIARCTLEFTAVNRRPADAMDFFPRVGSEIPAGPRL